MITYKNVTKNDANCECGEKETINHYLLECENYENEREQMRKTF